MENIQISLAVIETSFGNWDMWQWDATCIKILSFFSGPCISVPKLLSIGVNKNIFFNTNWNIFLLVRYISLRSDKQQKFHLVSVTLVFVPKRFPVGVNKNIFFSSNWNIFLDLRYVSKKFEKCQKIYLHRRVAALVARLYIQKTF